MGFNLLFLCDEYPPGKHGGIGTAVQSMARELVRQGHRVVAAGLYDAGYGSDFLIDHGVEVHRFCRPYQKPKSFTHRAVSWLARRLNPFESDSHPILAPYQTYVCRLIERHRIELLVIPDFHGYIPRCWRYRAPLRWPIPSVVIVHGGWTYFNKHEGLYVPDHWVRMERDILLQATAIASVSQYAARQTAAFLQIDRPITVLHNGIPIRDLQAVEKNDLQAIFTGSLWERKGVFQLMKAWNRVHAELPLARLLVLGKGSLEPVKAHLASESLDSVRFLGHVDQEELHRHLSESAVAVFPSYAETFGLAPLEAMQAEVATIFTSRTSGPELIDDGIDGLLVDPDDIDGLAARIIRLLQDRSQRDRLARNGWHKVRRVFGIDKVAKRYVEFFELMLAKRAAA